MPPKEESVTQFLNVDLDIRARAGLEELLRSMAPPVIVLHQAEQFAVVELSENYPSLDETIVKLVELIKSLPVQARSIWDQCEERAISIGIQAGSEPHAATFAISSKTVLMLAEAKFEVIITTYAPRS
jgi:hypothetical protein